MQATCREVRFPPSHRISIHPGLFPYIRGNHCAFFQNPLIFWHAVWCRLSGRVALRLLAVGVSQVRFLPSHRINFAVSFPPLLAVYPRTHGETGDDPDFVDDGNGLSPYTRGNHRCGRSSGDQFGSIPVHTGKPLCGAALPVCDWVYPRTHGETCHPVRRCKARYGLSPYTRGNPFRHSATAYHQGSIPVHTGKPLTV